MSISTNGKKIGKSDDARLEFVVICEFRYSVHHLSSSTGQSIVGGNLLVTVCIASPQAVVNPSLRLKEARYETLTNLLIKSNDFALISLLCDVTDAAEVK